MVTGAVSKLQYAVYPSSAYAPKTMTVTFPTTYTYPNSNAPMFGTVTGSTVAFGKLLSGMMRITMTGLGAGISGKLTLEGANIAGSAALTIDANSGEASLAAVANGTGSVAVSFTTLNTDPLVLDIPVPAATYTAGITAKLKIGDSADEPQVFKSTNDFEVKAGMIKDMPDINNIEIDANTGAITFSKVVESVDEAKKELDNGAMSVTINEVKENDVIPVPASSTADAPVTINIAKATNKFTVQGTNGGTGASVKINATEAYSGQLIIKDLDHAELSGSWGTVDSSTGENTLVVKAGAVVADLTVTKGNIEIETGAKVTKLTLAADVTINKPMNIRNAMEIVLGSYTLTLAGDTYTRIYEGGSLTLTGASKESKGKVINQGLGIGLNADGVKLKMTNVEYSKGEGESNGIIINELVSNVELEITDSKLTEQYYCLFTNALTPVGSGNKMTLKDSEFTAIETALLVNTPVTVTATNCIFTGGWQGAFMRGGTSTFDGCTFNLAVDSQYGASDKAAGADVWSNGNQAPSAALTIGNRGGAYDYAKNVELKNNCVFSVKVDNKDSEEYPAIYIDANRDQTSQLVTFKYANDTFSSVGGGLVINNTTGQVTVNGKAFHGAGG
ncbi:hypothetical protein [Bacteroides sp.]|uniref:hypothetical protein n=1 Tax=Bacteroides sp. TaxID=29523 RepID=UPI003AB5498F